MCCVCGAEGGGGAAHHVRGLLEIDGEGSHAAQVLYGRGVIRACARYNRLSEWVSGIPDRASVGSRRWPCETELHQIRTGEVGGYNPS